MSGNGDLDALARRLEAADFSGDSRVRASLRARLLAGRRRPSPLRAAVLAAAALAVLVPAYRLALRPEPAAYARGAEGLPVLPGRFDAAPAAGEAPVFVTALGREVPLKDGKAVEWELAGSVFRLETRRVAPEDLFGKPRWRGEL